MNYFCVFSAYMSFIATERAKCSTLIRANHSAEEFTSEFQTSIEK